MRTWRICEYKVFRPEMTTVKLGPLSFFTGVRYCQSVYIEYAEGRQGPVYIGDKESQPELLSAGWQATVDSSQALIDLDTIYVSNLGEEDRPILVRLLKPREAITEREIIAGGVG